MKQTGSCDSSQFGVHERVVRYYRTGETDTKNRPGAEEGVSIKYVAGHMHMVNQGRAGEPILWDYESSMLSPEIWVIIDSSGSIQECWEAETKENAFWDSQQPIILVNQRNESIIPAGGASVQMGIPNLTDISTLETIVGEASIPSWTATTIHKSITVTTTLLERLFLSLQQSHGLKSYTTITNALNYQHSNEQTLEYKLLWLRAASQILYNHPEQSSIPLLEARFTVSSSSGLPALI